ncbi:MAG TPA: prepilin-type N-terminal cleavage/methylation domain-containing protein [Planctomycetes bacterium]|nr:prepilin-type N-terminal cleavage/methylation domain-containing protein [Planctomycetota bacterium]HIK81856.1 prepilin-type N-terminal cleavage/methylation domain-containing protein [Planctomycetota bacterium]
MAQKGFTLIELIVVLGIFTIVMSMCYTILDTTLEADRRIKRATLTGKVGESILSQMRRDLQGVAWRGLGSDVFRGEDSGQDENAEDSIDFITTSPVGEPSEDTPNWTGELSSIGYALRPGKDGDSVLFRRVSWDLTEDPFDSGDRSPIYDRVLALDFEYLGEEGEWTQDWDASTLLPEQNLTDFPYLDERAAIAAMEAEEASSSTSAAAASEGEGGSSAETGSATGSVLQPGDIDPATGEVIVEEPLPRPLPRAVRIVLFLHYSDEQGQILNDDGSPLEEVFSTIVPLLAADQILVEDPESVLLEGSNSSF